MTVLDISATDALAGDFAGDLITPDHPAYDAQRRIWNGEIDRRPALLARCEGASDVVDDPDTLERLETLGQQRG